MYRCPDPTKRVCSQEKPLDGLLCGPCNRCTKQAEEMLGLTQTKIKDVGTTPDTAFEGEGNFQLGRGCTARAINEVITVTGP